jgi:hypothetical protein
MSNIRKGGQMVLAALAFVCALAVGFAAEARDFRIKGTDLGGGGAYEGRVSAEIVGNTVKVLWVVGNARYTGTGVIDGDWLAVHFTGPTTGVALYRRGSDGIIRGKWTTAGSTKVGTEDWYPIQ